MAGNKVQFTVWLTPEILRAVKARAVEEGSTASEVLAAAAHTVLIDSDRRHTDAQVLAAVERVFALVQRTDRRRGYDQQVLKEMVGLMVQSFFNHTPAIPEKDKKGALYSGKARFNRFLDTLAANLRAGQSILDDLPVPQEPQPPGSPAPNADSIVTNDKAPAAPETNAQSSPTPANDAPREKRTPEETRSRSNLFG